MSTTSRSRELRKLIDKNLSQYAELDAFLIDYFPAVYKHISPQMDRIAKVNLLLSSEDPETIWHALRQEMPTLSDTAFSMRYNDPDLTGLQHELSSKYPTYDSLSRFLRDHLRRNLDLFKNSKEEPFERIILTILQRAKSENWLLELITAIRSDRPKVGSETGTQPPSNPYEEGPSPSAALRKSPTQHKSTAIRVGILVMKDEERDAVLDQLDHFQEVPPDGNENRYYYRGNVEARTGNIEVVMVQTLRQGNLAAAHATQDLVNQWRPDHVILCGIAGGIHKDVGIGDVVIAEQVFYYEMAKLLQGERLSRLIAWTPSARLWAAAKSIRGTPTPTWVHNARKHKPPSSPILEDPKSAFGPIGSGDKVIANADAEELKCLRQISDKVSAVEMEAGGVASALHEKGMTDRLFVIRGISDHADIQKDDRFQRYAAQTAAAFAFAVIQRL